MTDKEIVNILLSQLDLKKVIRENPEISMDEVDGIVKKIKSFFIFPENLFDKNYFLLVFLGLMNETKSS